MPSTLNLNPKPLPRAGPLLQGTAREWPGTQQMVLSHREASRAIPGQNGYTLLP